MLFRCPETDKENIKLLLFEAINDDSKRLQRMIQEIMPEDNLEIYRTISSLALRLRQPISETVIAILLAATKEDLMDIFFINDLLFNIPTLLILPDREEATIKKGHNLRPRYLSYIDSNFSDIAAVLSNMLRGFTLKTKTECIDLISQSKSPFSKEGDLNKY